MAVVGAEKWPASLQLVWILLFMTFGIYLFLPQIFSGNVGLPPATSTSTDWRYQDDSCESRGQLPRYRRVSRFKPSHYLLSRLRRYEALHKICAPKATIHLDEQQGTYPSNEEGLGEGMFSHYIGECKYVVWIAYSGLGNQLLSVSSAFLYALLTDRILLVDGDRVFRHLFCEPFPESSWYLTRTFPRSWLQHLNETSPTRFGHLATGWNGSQEGQAPSYSYVHLTHTYGEDDRRFFCTKGQEFLRRIPWVFIRSDNYVIPGLHFVPSFRPELERLFPQRETAFHHLSRYLFHPSNEVWGRISRFQQQYLATAEKQLGIQVRTFDQSSQVPRYTTPQLLACVFGNNILPNLTQTDLHSCGAKACAHSRISVLVTSLQEHYYEQLRDIFLRQPTRDGQIVSIHQPSHEKWQKTENRLHDLKALAEMYLLSFSDELVTSAWSTFGYVAHSMAGLRPWILNKAEDGASTAPDPACTKGLSIEPCFHSPPLLDCEGKGGRDPGKILPHIRHCEDIPWGIKVFN